MQDGFEQAKKAPGKKNTKRWCKGKVGREHVIDIRKIRWVQSRITVSCGWRARWDYRSRGWDYDNPRWACHHEEYCTVCGKITKHHPTPTECPDFYEFDPAAGHTLPRSIYL